MVLISLFLINFGRSVSPPLCLQYNGFPPVLQWKNRRKCITNI
ncbi:hypothetical protein SUBVAR_05524 [Subdoligranulum variabile DSM 15176]|uniref:Uncharacterized protein n=1 Tax=Subdoligranulum variabile DSM 15176 TaxID=411471 RepID=D1PMG5_9FIRM|nr:hypothetical protein SUBVAR_05524 [Subdoligranulum variabile DSM 15176]